MDETLTGGDPNDYSRWFSALLDSPERSRVFLIAIEHPGTVDELAASCGFSSEVVAEHLSTLQQLGIVRTELNAGHTIYRLDEARIRRGADALVTRPTDIRSLAGGPAPSFVLPAADGQDVALADRLKEGPLALWFSSGLACPICRRNRARLALSYPAIRAMGADFLEVTPTPVSHAELYFSHYPKSFPYLCDPNQEVWASYGLRRGRLGALHVLGVLLPDTLGPKTIVNDWLQGPQVGVTTEEYTALGNEYGFFLIDQSGTIRQAEAGPYMGLPSNAEIERQLREIKD